MVLQVELDGKNVSIEPSFKPEVIIEIGESKKVFITANSELRVTSYIIAKDLAEAVAKNSLSDRIVAIITPRVMDNLIELFYGGGYVKHGS